MRTIDALAVSFGRLACLALTHSGSSPASDEIAAEAWLLEQDVVGLLHTMGGPASACYAVALSDADSVSVLGQSDAGAMLAGNCDPSTLAQFG